MKMTGHRTSAGYHNELWLLLPTTVGDKWAAGMKMASGRWVYGAWHLPGEHHSLVLPFRVRDGCGFEQGLRIGMQRLFEKSLRRGQLHDPTEIHDRDAMAYVPDHAESVRNEEISQAEFILKPDQQVDHLRLDRYIQSRDRLVSDDEFWFERKGARNSQPLPLAPGKFVRVFDHVFRAQPDPLKESGDPFLALPSVQNTVIDEGLANDGTRGQLGV